MSNNTLLVFLVFRVLWFINERYSIFFWFRICCSTFYLPCSIQSGPNAIFRTSRLNWMRLLLKLLRGIFCYTFWNFAYMSYFYFHILPFWLNNRCFLSLLNERLSVLFFPRHLGKRSFDFPTEEQFCVNITMTKRGCAIAREQNIGISCFFK